MPGDDLAQMLLVVGELAIDLGEVAHGQQVVDQILPALGGREQMAPRFEQVLVLWVEADTPLVARERVVEATLACVEPGGEGVGPRLA